VTARVEAGKIVLYAFGMTGIPAESFSRLARFTGGEYFSAAQGEAAIRSLREVLEREFGSLDYDRQVLECCASQAGWTIDGVCQALDSPRGKVSASLSRLGRRGLLG
jgi:hypothetical protein